MADRQPDRREDFLCGVGENANHRFGNDRLLIDDCLDFGERRHGSVGFVVAQVLRYDEAHQ